MVVDVLQNPQKSDVYEYEKKHVRCVGVYIIIAETFMDGCVRYVLRVARVDSGCTVFSFSKIKPKIRVLLYTYDQRIAYRPDRPNAGIEALPHYHQLLVMRPFFAFRQKSLFIAGRTSMRRVPKINNQNIFLYQVIQHRNWPLRSIILNAHVTNASPDGRCTRTHTNEAFSCWFCCNSFRVDRARRGNVCLSSEGMLSYRSACSEIERWFGY